MSFSGSPWLPVCRKVTGGGLTPCSRDPGVAAGTSTGCQRRGSYSLLCQKSKFTKLRIMPQHNSNHRLSPTSMGSPLPPQSVTTETEPTAQASPIHARTTCDGCGQFPLFGTRFKYANRGAVLMSTSLKYLVTPFRCLELYDYDLCQACFSSGLQGHLAFNSYEQPDAEPVTIPPRRSVSVTEAQPATGSVEDQHLVELKQWFASNKFSARVLERLIASDIGVQDVSDLACLGDEELQQAGMTPIQLKRFAVLQHKMNGANVLPTIPQLTENLNHIRQGFIGGKIPRAEAEYMGRGVTGDLARLTGTDAVVFFGMFVATLDPTPAVSKVPQVVSFIPAGPVTIKVSFPGESDRFVETDNSGILDVKDFPSQCSLQPMTKTRPPIPVGIPHQLELPLTAEKTVDLPATSVQSMFRDCDKPLSNCKATGKFVSAGSSTAVQISATTDDCGTLNMVLPPGRISDLHAQSDDGKVKIAAESVDVPVRDLDLPPQPMERIFSQQSSRIPFLNRCHGKRVAFLGDVSGSMQEDGNGKDSKLVVLQRTLSDAVDEVLAPNSTKTVSLCAWNHETKWFQSKRWLSAADKVGAKGWIQHLDADGQTHMGPAIMEAVRLERVSDIVTLCDGDFEDFDFDTVARSNPEVRFHFVAIGDQAATGEMMKMATKGRGVFQHERSVPAADPSRRGAAAGFLHSDSDEE